MTVTMVDFARFCARAQAGEAEKAARAFLQLADEQAATLVMDAATWRDEYVKDFEQRKLAVLIEGRWGQFWLASPLCEQPLSKTAPRLAPSGLVALARAVVDLLLKDKRRWN